MTAELLAGSYEVNKIPVRLKAKKIKIGRLTAVFTKKNAEFSKHFAALKIKFVLIERKILRPSPCKFGEVAFEKS